MDDEVRETLGMVYSRGRPVIESGRFGKRMGQWRRNGEAMKAESCETVEAVLGFYQTLV